MDAKLETFYKIINEIEENSLSLKKACKLHKMSSATFDAMIDNDEQLKNQYARAREKRADNFFEEIRDIANHTEEDHTPFTGSNVIQRDRLKIDSLKWMLSKMLPKVYGDKQEIDQTTTIKTIEVRTNEK